MKVPGSGADTALPDEALLLFEIPPEEFTKARDKLARKLKTGGDDSSAAAVKSLKKPSVVAHGLNLVSRRRPELIQQLMSADEALRNARSRQEMDRGRNARQTAIGSICSEALALLGSEGRRSTAGAKEKLTDTLLAAATDQETRSLVQAGMLVREAVPSGFGPMVSLEPAPKADPAASRRAARLRSEAQAKLEEASGALRDAQAARREAVTLAEQSEAALARAERAERLAVSARELAEAKLKEAEELESDPD